ncbi:MAG: hypothetical protein ATN32_06250 [Candidatus Epulonipiscium fishelsonii]|nr:MAG: hypothetical protein ATN32_06250 [Epulopiscium sp. AS2M-Bin002]
MINTFLLLIFFFISDYIIFFGMFVLIAITVANLQKDNFKKKYVAYIYILTNVITSTSLIAFVLYNKLNFLIVILLTTLCSFRIWKYPRMKKIIENYNN